MDFLRPEPGAIHDVSQPAPVRLGKLPTHPLGFPQHPIVSPVVADEQNTIARILLSPWIASETDTNAKRCDTWQ